MNEGGAVFDTLAPISWRTTELNAMKFEVGLKGGEDWNPTSREAGGAGSPEEKRRFSPDSDTDGPQYSPDLCVEAGMDGMSQFSATMPGDNKIHIAQVFRDMSARLRRFVRARVPSETETDDILQDVWQQFTAALDVRPVEQVGAWLYTVARNRIIDRYRRPQPESLDALAEGRETGDGSAVGAWWPVDGRTPATELHRQQFWEQLHAALAELPPEQRQVFVWHEFEDLSFQQIATLTGENLNTLLSRKRYAVLHLRKRLQPLRDEFLSHPDS
jgi:RNA polymerase sigma factor (sigma-70 family)